MLGQSCASGLFRSRHKKHFLNYHVLACLVWSPQTRLQMSQRIIMKISWYHGLFLVLFCFLQGFFLPLISRVVSLFQMFKWHSGLWFGNGNNMNTDILWLGKPCDDAINLYIFKSYNYWEETSQKQKFPSQPQRQIMPPTHQSRSPTPVLFFSTILSLYFFLYIHGSVIKINYWTQFECTPLKCSMSHHQFLLFSRK